MRIVEIREVAVPLQGGVANSVVSFDGHTVSLVALISDVVRDGRRLVGVAFNSIGRHAQGGILRDRMVPRVLGAEPESLCSRDTGLLDPARVLAAAMRDEKPGGHGDRASAASAIELACWDLLAKFHDEPAHVTDRPRPRADPGERRGCRSTRRGATTTPATPGPAARRARGLPRCRIRSRQDQDRRAADRRGHGAMEAAIEVMGSGSAVAVDANGRFGRDRRSSTRARSTVTACAGTRRRAIRSTSTSTARSPRPTPAPSRPARTSSPCRT